MSYSHRDEVWKNLVVQHLRVLEPEGSFEVWEDCRIAAGTDWLPEITAAVDSAAVAVMLVSVDFLGSKFILGEEVPRLLKRRAQDGLRLVPLIVRPCAWQGVSWILEIQGRPKDGAALSGMRKAVAEKARSATVSGRENLRIDIHYISRHSDSRVKVLAKELATRIKRDLERVGYIIYGFNPTVVEGPHSEYHWLNVSDEFMTEIRRVTDAAIVGFNGATPHWKRNPHMIVWNVHISLGNDLFEEKIAKAMVVCKKRQSGGQAKQSRADAKRLPLASGTSGSNMSPKLRSDLVRRCRHQANA